MTRRMLAAHVLEVSGARHVLGELWRYSGLVVLNYHRVGQSSDTLFDRGLWSANPSAFAEQVRFCKKHFDVIRADDLQLVRHRRGRYLLLTFDDGYRDNYTAAFPILKSENAPATFFVTTGFIESSRLPWWDEIAWMVRTSERSSFHLPGYFAGPIARDFPDPELAIRKLLRRYKGLEERAVAEYLDRVGDATGTGRFTASIPDLWMTWDMLREMREAGMTIGGHTAMHPVLARLSPERQHHEVMSCRQAIAEKLSIPMRYFSYPVGGRDAFNDATRRSLSVAGVEAAFSYYGGYNRTGHWDDYDLRRIPIETYLTPQWFRCLATLPQLFG